MSIFEPGMGTHYVLSSPRSPHEARELVRRAAGEAHWSGDLDAAVLSASEIVANAFIHTGAVGRVEVVASETHLRVEADDLGRGEPAPCHADVDATSGRGMAIVVSLSDAWGVDRHDPGKTVWFEMSAPGARPRLG